ncbi:hypothetical protein BH11MYX4_BH11MYX4_25210 [soil metagenome]
MTPARFSVAALLALVLAACATPNATAPRHSEPSGEPVVAGEDAGANLALGGEPLTTVATAPPPPPARVAPSVVSPSDGACATSPSAADHPLALALTRDLGVRFATYACVFRSTTDPDVAVTGFRVRAVGKAAPFAPLKSYGERRPAFLLQRYAAELGLSGAPRQELVVVSDGSSRELAMSEAGMSHLLQRVPSAWIGSDGFVDVELGAGAEPFIRSIDLAIVAHAERLAAGPRVSRQIAQEAALKAARADGAVPARLARKPTLALRTTASGTTLVYDFTVARVIPTIGGFSEGPTWLVRVDAATGKVASLHHD